MRLSLSSSTSSTSYPHPLSRSSHSQMFFKIGVLKACHFIKKRLQHSCFPVTLAKFLKHPFLQKISGGCYYLRCFSWMFLLLLLPYHTSTTPLQYRYFLRLKKHFHYHYIISIIIAEWFIRIAATATTYCTAISMIVLRICTLMDFMLKRKKITHVWIKYNWKTLFHSGM